MGGYLLSTTIALGVVCALAIGLLRLLGRRAPAKGARLKILERLPLEARRSLYLVEAGGRVLVVGVGDGAMTTLAELDGERLRAETPAVAPAPASAPTVGEAFRTALKRVLGGARSGHEAG